MAVAYKNFRDGAIKIADGTGTPIELAIQYEPGNFSFSALQEGQTETAMYLDRGAFASLRKTNFVPVTGSFSAYLVELSDGTNKTLIDAVRKGGAFGSGTSTLTGSDAWTVDITLDIEGTNFGESSDHQIKFEDCRVVIDFSEGDPDEFTVNFTCYGTISLT